MSSELDSLKQRIIELKAKNAEVKAKYIKSREIKKRPTLLPKWMMISRKSNNNRPMPALSRTPTMLFAWSLEYKETDDFLDEIHKKRISDKIRQRNKEKKIQCESTVPSDLYYR
uniref:Uncharacterized protein n=1 Tax=Rhizophagus irregularis (strain DAOM 181602 / DAOM 197198 / MUCL 43194) TaxID=747089 RepID=U9UVI8_RHIID